MLPGSMFNQILKNGPVDSEIHGLARLDSHTLNSLTQKVMMDKGDSYKRKALLKHRLGSQ